MDVYAKKSQVLLEALPYIKDFHDKIVVVKFGGSSMLKDSLVKSILENIVFMRFVGIHPIIVHGGGSAINNALKERAIDSKFIQGLRVTDQSTMDIVQDILLNRINMTLVKTIRDLGANPCSMNDLGEDLITVSKATVINNNFEDGDPLEEKYLDLGFVGEVQSINTARIEEMLKNKTIPVIAPLGLDSKGMIHNINADCVAGRLASIVEAEKIIYLTDVDGIYYDNNTSKTLISSIRISEIQALIDQQVIYGGMLPKVNSCIDALQNGARKAHIINGYLTNSLILEIFTDRGIGTEILC